MDLSILIPTFGRARKLANCLVRLAHQALSADRFEVLIGVDGKDEAHEPDDEAAQAAHAVARTVSGSIRAVVHEFDHAGPGMTRNRLAAHARGRLLLLLNDDVLPEPDLLEVHLAAHAERARNGTGPAMILGAAPWVKPPTGEDTLFDRVVRETSMIFFYDQMDAALAERTFTADHDWGFRHAWTLNLSLPRTLFNQVHGFDPRLRFACYEDLEFAYRVQASVLYRPAAVVHHDHRIHPESYLARERLMGRAAWEFAAACPDCARVVFGRDIRSPEEVRYSREFVARERAAADRLRETFLGLAQSPAADFPGAPGSLTVRLAYQQHLLLKRWMWRSGLVEAAATEPTTPL